MVGQKRGAVTMVVVALHLVEEAAYVLAQRSSDGKARLAPATTMGGDLVPPEPQPATIDRVLAPGGFREEAGEMGVVSPLEDAAGSMGPALRGQHDQAGQIGLDLSQL